MNVNSQSCPRRMAVIKAITICRITFMLAQSKATTASATSRGAVGSLSNT